LSVLGLSQRPIIMPHYPHMLSEDIEVWTRYLTNPISSIVEVWYDVHVGGGIKVGDQADALTQKIALGVGRKRIDVIARVGGGFWVVELKPYASMAALGQIITYSRLFIEEYHPIGEVWPVIICNDFDDDCTADFDALGVIVIENDRV